MTKLCAGTGWGRLCTDLTSFTITSGTPEFCRLKCNACAAKLQILDSLIEEDDSVPNVWYMLAMCLLGGGQTEAAAEALQHGQKLLRKQSDTDDLAQDFRDLKASSSHS